MLASDQLREAGEFWQVTLDSLNAHIAVLDDQGTIVAVNQPWRRFASSEGGHTDYIGASYVAVCDAAADALADEAAQALKEILAGTRAEFVLEYPCHSPSTQRCSGCARPDTRAPVPCAWSCLMRTSPRPTALGSS
jgi:two-component system sensor kinase FixL